MPYKLPIPIPSVRYTSRFTNNTMETGTSNIRITLSAEDISMVILLFFIVTLQLAV